MDKRIEGSSLAACLKRVGAIGRSFRINSLMPRCAACEELLRNAGTVDVAILGQFKAGKSSFLNALIGVAVFGEIGGPYEEEAAECVRKKEFTKPLVIFVAGAWAPEGMRFSHASSIIERGKGSAKSKIQSLKEAGVHVVDRPDELAPTIKRLIQSQ